MKPHLTNTNLQQQHFTRLYGWIFISRITVNPNLCHLPDVNVLRSMMYVVEDIGVMNTVSLWVITPLHGGP